MERRNFLKGLFGAAVVAAMPKSVVEQIENLPPKPISPAINGATPIFTKRNPVAVDIYGDNMLFIYDDKQLVGYTDSFKLDFQQDIHPISKSKWVKLPWDGTYYKNKKKKNGQPKKKHRYQLMQDHQAELEYWKGPMSWDISASNIHWHVDEMELFQANKHLNCLIAQGEARITGEVLMTDIALMAPMGDAINAEAHFIGSGQLIMDTI